MVRTRRQFDGKFKSKIALEAIRGLRPISEMYDLLFQSAWQSLSEVIAEEQGYEAAATMVLHSWNQKLEPHAHVHAVVPGGGPALAGKDRWLTSLRPGVLPTVEEMPLDRQEPVVSASVDEDTSAEATTPCCAGCGAVMVCTADDARTSWFRVLHSPRRPIWYSDG